MLANELKSNNCKLGKWTVQAILAGVDYIKFGLVFTIIRIRYFSIEGKYEREEFAC